MTRINVVPVTELTNKHLMAEYRELPRLFTDVRKRISNRQSIKLVVSKQPAEYKLGTGHVMFFLTRLGYALNRYYQLADELLERGYNLDLELFNDICDSTESIPLEWFGSYQPTKQAIEVNRERIAKRLAGIKD